MAQIFLEPEGRNTPELYVQGFSTGLPERCGHADRRRGYGRTDKLRVESSNTREREQGNALGALLPDRLPSAAAALVNHLAVLIPLKCCHSLTPRRLQLALLRTLPGLEHVKILRAAYAVR